MACSLAVALLLSGPTLAQVPGEARSTFVPRAESAPALLPVPKPSPTPARPISAQVVPVQAKTPSGESPRPATDDAFRAYVRLDPPGREKLFGSRDTEAELEERMRQEKKDAATPGTVAFPPNPTLTAEAYKPRQFPAMTVLAEPSYVVYQRLFFEERNAERYGWEMGPIQPLVSTLYFFKDVAFLPYHAGTDRCRCWETSAGQCRPGDPIPYLCYPPELSWSGALAQTGAIIGLGAFTP